MSTQTSAPAKGGLDYLQRAYHLTGSTDAQNLYDEWAAEYDSHNQEGGYASPRRCVDVAIANLDSTRPGHDLKAFDAGCGTGLVGDALAQSPLASKCILDGVDVSDGMLKIARTKGVYRDLETADLNKAIEKPDALYDIVFCVGTLTKGHVGPKVIEEFARITVESGLIVATVHADIWESGGYKGECERLRDAGTVQIVSTDEFGILEGSQTGGRMVVLRKQ